MVDRHRRVERARLAPHGADERRRVNRRAVAAAPRADDDRHPVLRALEVVATTGRPLSALQVEHARPAPSGVRVFALERPRDELRDRIDRRVT
ncbi:MAG: tRNA (adenosine(37)-N6)-dimethylallyltransferase MiaA, partial [Gemmatimonadaceae bacterium]